LPAAGGCVWTVPLSEAAGLSQPVGVSSSGLRDNNRCELSKSFEVQVFEGSREERLLNFEVKQTNSPERYGNVAPQGFLMPLAYRDNDVTSREVWVLRDSIHRLQQQVQYFQEITPLPG